VRAAFRFLVVLLLITCGAAAPAWAEKRLALVVGNNAYPTAPLQNPVNDAKAMAQSLEAAGFTVILRLDARQSDLLAALREFGNQLKDGGPGTAGLFYFAGHGMQIKGRNFLIPVGANIEHEDEVSYQALDAQAVMDKMESAGNGTNIVILDACRNNPFARSFRSSRQGLAQMDAPVGTLVAFSTAPGSVAADSGAGGGNGLYTAHLLRAIQRPGQKVEDVFKQVRLAVLRESGNRQVPWEASSLIGDFYFRAPSETAPAAAAAMPDIQASLDEAFWAAVKDSTSSAELFAYLNRFPNGRYAKDARAKLADLVAPGAGAPKPPPAPQSTPPFNADPGQALRDTEKADLERQLREHEQAEELRVRGIAEAQKRIDEIVKWGDIGTNTRKANPRRNAQGFAEGDRYRWRVYDEQTQRYTMEELWRVDRIEPDGSLWVNDGRQRFDAFGQQRGGNDIVTGQWVDWSPPLPLAQALRAAPSSELQVLTQLQMRDAEGRITRSNLKGTVLGAVDASTMTPEGLQRLRRIDVYLSGLAVRTDGQRWGYTLNVAFWFKPGVGLPVKVTVDERHDDRLVRRTTHEVTALDVFSLPATMEDPAAQ
jgi:uncharacterized caspase-like protein